jgi:DNA (cytosine-5)-methyltransferase 1
MDVALRPTRVLSICTGIGGLDLGVRLAVPGSRVVGYVERDSYSAAVIVARMGDEALDEAPIWDDVATFDGRRWRGAVDIVTAGFPCQPWSTAGSRAGTADPRWIWPDIARIIGEVGPEWVFLENVPGLVSGGGLAEVLGSLAALGFDAEWTSVWASEVGAPHRRERVFILGRRRGVADTRAERRERGSGVEGNGRLPSIWSEAGDPARHGDREVVDPSGDLRGTFGDGGPGSPDGAGDRYVADPGGLQRPVPSPGSAEGAGGEIVAGAGRGRDMGDSDRPRLQGRGDGPGGADPDELDPRATSPPYWPPGPNERDEWARILARWPTLAPATVEPTVRHVDDGVSAGVGGPAPTSREGVLRSLGNAVVPASAAHAFGILRARFEVED